MEVVVAVVVKGAAESLCVSIVSTGSPNRQAHSPVTNIGPNEGPRGKNQLQEESHNQQLINNIMLQKSELEPEVSDGTQTQK